MGDLTSPQGEQDDAELIRRVTANAMRLLDDARLLARNGRFQSAFALGILAMEEVGKLILQKWARPDDLPPPRRRISYHIRKQTAVAHLVAAPMLITEMIVHLAQGAQGEERVELLAKALFESREGRWMRHAEIGAIEKTKHLSLYSDMEFIALGLQGEDFNGGDVEGLERRVNEALALLNNDWAMRVARATYVQAISSR